MHHRAHKWRADLITSVPARWASDVRDEIVCAALLLAGAYSNMRWPLDGELSARDATPCSGGSVSCVVGREIIAALYRSTEYR